MKVDCIDIEDITLHHDKWKHQYFFSGCFFQVVAFQFPQVSLPGRPTKTNKKQETVKFPDTLKIT